MFQRFTKTYSEHVPAVTFSEPPMSQFWRHPCYQLLVRPSRDICACITWPHLPASFVYTVGRVFESYSFAYQLSRLILTRFLCNRRHADGPQNQLEGQLTFPRDEKENRGKNCWRCGSTTDIWMRGTVRHLWVCVLWHTLSHGAESRCWVPASRHWTHLNREMTWVNRRGKLKRHGPQQRKHSW